MLPDSATHPRRLRWRSSCRPTTTDDRATSEAGTGLLAWPGRRRRFRRLLGSRFRCDDLPAAHRPLVVDRRYRDGLLDRRCPRPIRAHRPRCPGHLLRHALRHLPAIRPGNQPHPSPPPCRPRLGQGSWGNGAAMRIAPLGAYFLRRRHRPRDRRGDRFRGGHPHPPRRNRGSDRRRCRRGNRSHLLAHRRMAGPRHRAHPGRHRPPRDSIRRETPDQHRPTPRSRRTRQRRTDIGRRHRPFCLWTAANHPADFPGALRTAASTGGDTDTTCAIVGGILATRTPPPGMDQPLRTPPHLAPTPTLNQDHHALVAGCSRPMPPPQRGDQLFRRAPLAVRAEWMRSRMMWGRR